MAIYCSNRKVRLQDIDAAGIVYFAKFLEYCHDAYFEFVESQGVNLAHCIENEPFLLPLVHASADFCSPLRFGDSIEVLIESITPKKASFSVEYSIFNKNSNVLSCKAKTVHVAISKETFKSLDQLPQLVNDFLGTM